MLDKCFHQRFISVQTGTNQHIMFQLCSKMLLTLIFCWCLALTLSVPLQEAGPLKTKSAVGGRIIGGQAAFAGQFPYIAALDVHTSDGVYYCGGALLTNQWVITAAHCADGAILFQVQLGSNSLSANDPNLIRLTTDSYVLHPDYNPLTLANDIGLVEFRMPITFSDYVRPIDLLPSSVLSDYSPLRTMGWGQISDSDAGRQSQLQWVAVTIISNAECRVVYGSQILDTMACAEGNYNEGTCYGDTGGPLILYVTGGQVMHVGVSSFFSNNGCESTDPSGYTRTYTYVDWIRNTTGFL